MLGCSSWGGVCSLDDSVVTLLAFPYLRVGELLDCGVYGVRWLRSLRSRLPFVVRPPFHVSVCPSPALVLGWFGHRPVTPPAASGFWALLESRLSRRLLFSWNLSLGSSLSLPVFADGLGWLGLILGYPPSVAWLWRLLPWFFVRYLSAWPLGAAVPLDSLVLWCSWSSR